MRAPLGYAIATGVITGYLVTRPFVGLWTWQNLVIVLVAIVICSKTVTLLHHRLPTTERIVVLAAEVHKEMSELARKGITMLYPPDSVTHIVHLRIKVEDDTVIVDYVKRDERYHNGPIRTFRIGSDGRVGRAVRRRSDRAWCQASLVHQLEYLLAAASPGGYAQRQEVSWARREDR
jgi:hypothetical protein